MAHKPQNPRLRKKWRVPERRWVGCMGEIKGNKNILKLMSTEKCIALSNWIVQVKLI